MDISSEEYKAFLRVFHKVTERQLEEADKNLQIIVQLHPEQFSDKVKQEIKDKFSCLESLERELTEAERILTKK